MSLRRKRVEWKKGYRAVNSKWPPVSLFEEVSSPIDWEDLYALESLTNDRLSGAGNFLSIPLEERRTGSGSSPVMAAFAHSTPGRFNPEEFGAYYAADSLLTALSERAYHVGRFFREAGHLAGPTEDTRLYVGRLTGNLNNVRNHPKYHQDNDYEAGQLLARELRTKGHDGVLYRSLRNPGSDCVAILRPSLVDNPVPGPHFSLRFDGKRVTVAVDYRDGLVLKLG